MIAIEPAMIAIGTSINNAIYKYAVKRPNKLKTLRSEVFMLTTYFHYLLLCFWCVVVCPDFGFKK